MKLFYFRVLQGGTPENYYCLDFEIAVDQQLGPVAELLRVFRTPGVHRCPRDSHAYIWSIFGPILPNHLNMLSYEQNTMYTYMGIRTKYDRFWPINWANINILE